MIAARAGEGGTWVAAGVTGVVCALAIAVFAWLIFAGAAPFWPARIVALDLRDGSHVLGEIVAEYAADARSPALLVMRGSERERVGGAYRRVRADEILARSEPADAVVLTLTDGRRLFARGVDADTLLGSALPPATALELRHANALGFGARCLAFLGDIASFVSAPPAATNLAGGVLPALLGTLTLVLLMSVIVMPFGVATAVYLHRRPGLGTHCVRVAINQLAGVPSIVYGVLGLGLFVHGIGAGIDHLFYADRLPVPTFGGGGLLWAAATLALLTLPVVVVSVEEGLARIPPSLAEGSLALGATREETLWHLLLPAARPALLTGLILAIARAAGAVAPLMLVGVVKLAPALPLDGVAPFLHPSRQFMHLGFSIYDAALASPDAIRGVPRAYACAALLVLVAVAANLAAVALRNRLRRRYAAFES